MSDQERVPETVDADLGSPWLLLHRFDNDTRQLVQAQVLACYVFPNGDEEKDACGTFLALNINSITREEVKHHPACPTFSAQLDLPPDVARRLGRELLEWSDWAEKAAAALPTIVPGPEAQE